MCEGALRLCSHGVIFTHIVFNGNTHRSSHHIFTGMDPRSMFCRSKNCLALFHWKNTPCEHCLTLPIHSNDIAYERTILMHRVHIVHIFVWLRCNARPCMSHQFSVWSMLHFFFVEFVRNLTEKKLLHAYLRNQSTSMGALFYGSVLYWPLIWQCLWALNLCVIYMLFTNLITVIYPMYSIWASIFT